MNKMIERVARAMQKRAAEPVGNIPSLEPVLVGSLGDTWAVLAEAAIAEMREPTDEMIEAYYNTDRDFSTGPSRDRWRAMIDAATGEAKDTFEQREKP